MVELGREFHCEGAMQIAGAASTGFVLAFVTLGTAISCVAVEGRSTPDALPQKVVEEYCRLDLEGARMSSSTWAKVKGLVAWEEEPGWDVVVIVATYRLGKPRMLGDEVHVPVTFNVLAKFEGDGPLELAERRERIDYELERQTNRWVIRGPIHPPYVSIATEVRSLRSLYDEEPEGTERKRNLRDAIMQLEALQR